METLMKRKTLWRSIVPAEEDRLALRELVESRVRSLKERSYDDLARLAIGVTEPIMISTRNGTISRIVEATPDERLRIVVQGLLPIWPWLPQLKSVCVDGFYKDKNGVLSNLSDSDLYSYS